MSLTQSVSGSLNADNLRQIFEWKLQANHRARALTSLAQYELVNPGEVQSKTAEALVADDDAGALLALRGLPQAKSTHSVAVASCLLMCLDPQRWSVIDRRALTSIMFLKSTLFTDGGPLNDLRKFMSSFEPPIDKEGRFVAHSKDWPIYMRICREIREVTGLTLREIDRGLYESNGRN